MESAQRLTRASRSIVFAVRAGLAIQRFRQAYAGLIANSDESGQPEIVFAIVTCETNRLQPEKSYPMFKIEWGKILRCSFFLLY